MEFWSILGYDKTGEIEHDKISMPKYFYDLNLDQIVQDIMEEQKLYDLRRFYYFKPESEDIKYRQEVLKDMDDEKIFQSIIDFSIGIRKTKEYLGNITQTDNDLQKEKWNLDAAFCYISCVTKLQTELESEALSSEGLKAFRNWLYNYINREDFGQLKEDVYTLIKQFDEMKFHIKIKRDRVIINQGYLEEDYCRQLQDTFKEQPGQMHFYQNNPFGTILLSSLEEAVLEVLSKPYEEIFVKLSEFSKRHHDFMNGTINEFELESQFYIAFLLYRKRMEEHKFHFCYPKVDKEQEFMLTRGYDLALAKKNAQQNKEVIFNDCYLDKGERFFVVTGPNQGGKTTFARALGQIIYFAALGLMVPCEAAALPVFDGIYTHFAVEENIDTGAGKLKEELIRLKEMMENTAKHSFVIINEIFTSATSYDAFIMGKKVIDHYLEEDCYGVYVTHIHELTKGDDRIVSLVAALLSDDSNIRTFKIERRHSDGRSYANTIVEKHHMTYREIKERLKK